MDRIVVRTALALSVAIAMALHPVTAVGGDAAAPPPCPPPLLGAARAELGLLRAEAKRIRLSTVDAPEGLEQVQAFDRATHNCHLAQGQRRRDYGDPVCRPAASDGRVPVRYPYRLQHRQAGSVAALFALPWKDGPGGALEVEFELLAGAWVPGARRELLDVNQDTGD